MVSFVDLPSSHPAYPYVGVYAMTLPLADPQRKFRPDEPLTREELLAYKSEVDWGKPTTATATQVSQAWQFSDAAAITPEYLGAILKDQTPNSNLKRVWGATTRLEPQTPVTRAEAAASLWRIGPEAGGRTAEEVVQRRGL